MLEAIANSPWAFAGLICGIVFLSSCLSGHICNVIVELRELAHALRPKP